MSVSRARHILTLSRLLGDSKDERSRRNYVLELDEIWPAIRCFYSSDPRPLGSIKVYFLATRIKYSRVAYSLRLLSTYIEEVFPDGTAFCHKDALTLKTGPLVKATVDMSLLLADLPRPSKTVWDFLLEEQTG